MFDERNQAFPQYPMFLKKVFCSNMVLTVSSSIKDGRPERDFY